MEENSEAQMETDVSSADSIDDTSGSQGSLETVIVVETKEEDLAPESMEKQLQSDLQDNIPIKDTLPVPVLIKIPHKTPQKSLNPTPPAELSVQKDMLVVKTYSRSPVSLLKSVQKSPTKPDLSQNTQLALVVADSSSKLTDKKDVKSPIKEQFKSLQTSPSKPEQSKDIQSKTDTAVSVSTDSTVTTVSLTSAGKMTVQEDIKSPAKDQGKGLQISPSKPEQAKDILPLLDTPDCIARTTPEKDLNSSTKDQPQAPQRSLILLDPPKHIKPLPEIKDCSDKITINKDNQTSEKEEKEQSLSEDSKVSKSEKSPVKISLNNSALKILRNPLLVTALFGDTETTIPGKDKAEIHVESNSITLCDSSVEIISEKSSDSVQEIIPDSTEIHNKSISRELKSLIKSAKDSKIISECTRLTTKTRKSRGILDTSSSNTTNTDPERPIGSQWSSLNSLMSSCSERSEKNNLKRSMRSQNPEFVNKVKLFLNSVTGKVTKIDSEIMSEEEMEGKKGKVSLNDSIAKSPKMKKISDTESTTLVKGNKIRTDPYCWRCHWAVEQEANDKQHSPMTCTVCPRSFHYKCLSGTERGKILSEKSWVCPECLSVLHAESSETRSPAMKKTSLGCLCELLQYALNRMMDLNGVEPFMQPVDRTLFPDYDKYVVHPMDLVIMKNNIIEGLYGSTEAFLADAQWILHNSIIFNTLQSKLTAVARAIVRSCKVETAEIEACPECYSAAHSRRSSWFTNVCTTPHVLLWAKLKGFPYWPAKCMSVSSASLVDVRFFGAHDRAWVPARDCYLFSEKDPNNFRTKRQDIVDSMQEAEQHILNISRKYGKFVYPPFKTQLDPTKLTEQLKIMIPSFEGEIKVPVKDKSTPKMAKTKSRSNSKGSKASSNDGEVSENEDTKLQPRKMAADGAEIAMEEDFTVERDKTLLLTEVEPPKAIVTSRKRRRSELEEAVITIMEGPKEKRRCVESMPMSQDKQLVSDKPAEESPGQEADKAKVAKVETIPTLTSAIAPVNDKELLNNSVTSEIKRPPIKMILKTNKSFKTSSPKDKSNPGKTTPFKLRVMRIEKKKSTDKEKHDKVKSHKRRNSKNKSLITSTNRILIVDKTYVNKTSNIDSKNNKTKIQDESIIIHDISEDNISKSKENGDQKEDSNSKAQREIVKNNTVTKPQEEKETNENKTAKSTDLVKSNENSSTKTMVSDKSKDTNGKINKDSPKAKYNNPPKYKETVGNIHNSRRKLSAKPNSIANTKTAKERIQYDEDNTSLALIAREGSKRGSLTGLPTITSVRSLSSPQTVEGVTKTSTLKINEGTDTLEVFTPTSTDIVHNMKEAVTKLNMLRSDNDQSLVGKVGVCAFARMPSTPPIDNNSNKSNEDDAVGIKSELMDFDDADRQVEKLLLMNSFSLRPVSTTHSISNLREVRINKITAGPANARKATTKAAEPKNKAKKTAQQQKKGDEGRSELNSKNSMVYIPIQPPVTQAPVKVSKPITVNRNTATVPASRANVAVTANKSPTVVNVSPSTKVVSPLTQSVVPASDAPTPVAAMTVVSVTSQAVTPIQTFPSIGPMPTSLHSVHTVPLITSVNGQWTFSLQPIMSVGGLDALDGESTPQLFNGRSTAERITSLPAIMPPAPVNGATVATSYATAPKSVMASITVASNLPSPNLAMPPLQPLQQNALVSPSAIANRSSPEDIAATVGEPPRLQHKPLLHPFDDTTPVGTVPPIPTDMGPITAKLNQNAAKLTDFFRTLLEDTIAKIDEPAAEATKLRKQLEEVRWQHRLEVEEIKHNHDLMIKELRSTLGKELEKAVEAAQRAAKADLEAAVKSAKTKQWCANCNQEAQLYCCWNTSYCDYTCQRTHWTQHYAACTQQRTQDSNTNTDRDLNSVNNRLQPASENLPKTSTAPTLSKGPVARVFSRDLQTGPKSLIVSVVEDRSGNTTMKCVGTFKPSTLAQSPTQPVVGSPIPAPVPLMRNKPVTVVNNEDIATKKVVTSGGYLIVGAPNSAALVASPRQSQPIQYFS